MPDFESESDIENLQGKCLDLGFAIYNVELAYISLTNFHITYKI